MGNRFGVSLLTIIVAVTILPRSFFIHDHPAPTIYGISWQGQFNYNNSHYEVLAMLLQVW